MPSGTQIGGAAAMAGRRPIGAACCHWLRAGFRTLLGKDEGPVVGPLATAESDPSQMLGRSACGTAPRCTPES